MNVTPLQTRLRDAGRDPGPLDGVLGPRTLTALLGHLAHRTVPAERVTAVGAALAEVLPLYDIWSVLRLQHFLAQVMHETGDLTALVERGGPTYFQKYDGRQSLGNGRPGDGYRFRGRGLVHLTGRANYNALSGRVGVDLVADPDRAAEAPIAALVAAIYWIDRDINAPADRDDLVGVTRKINGGLNGLEDRHDRLEAVRKVWGAAA